MRLSFKIIFYQLSLYIYIYIYKRYDFKIL